MDEIGAAVMIKALDGLTTRAAVTAENIANAGTPGFRPRGVSFEDALASAASQGVDAVGQVKPRIGWQDGAAASSDVRMDLELSTASATATRYSALVEVLNREIQMQTLVLAGNK